MVILSHVFRFKFIMKSSTSTSTSCVQVFFCILFTCIGLKAASHKFLVLNLYLLEVRQYLYDKRPHQSVLSQAQLPQKDLQYYQCHFHRHLKRNCHINHHFISYVQMSCNHCCLICRTYLKSDFLKFV